MICLEAKAMVHEHQIRVYYEDTDFAGIVYYANYFKFIERARTELLREIGVDQTIMLNEHKMVFVVRRLEADFCKPTYFNDLITVQTKCLHHSKVKVTLFQTIIRESETVFNSEIELASVNDSGRIQPLPVEIQQKFDQIVE